MTHKTSPIFIFLEYCAIFFEEEDEGGYMRSSNFEAVFVIFARRFAKTTYNFDHIGSGRAVLF